MGRHALLAVHVDLHRPEVLALFAEDVTTEYAVQAAMATSSNVTGRKPCGSYTLAGNDLDRMKVEHAVDHAESKYCAVSASLDPRILVTRNVIRI